jgi:hypothetical protein
MHTLEQLHSGALAGVRQLRLVNQGLTHWPEALYSLADTLELLDLSGNQLSELPEDLPRLHRLRILFASQNPFTTLPSVLGRMPQLEMLGFKACQITSVPAESLPPRLRWLILTDNAIEHLPDTLGQRPRLQKLMLACNRLTALPATLAGHPRLELLRLAANRITALQTLLPTMPSLAWAALAGNPLTQAAETQVLDSHRASALPWPALHLGPPLGQGASGQVFQAQRLDRGETLAVKLFHAGATSDGTPQSEMAAGLATGPHAHLLAPQAPVTGHPEGRLAMSLPLLPADLRPLAAPPSLESCTRDVYGDAPLAPGPALRLLAHVSAALAHLHAQGVVHGDLYAHNILWRDSDGHAVLSDLGAAMLTQALPAAEAFTLQRLEMRALGILIAEVLAHSPALAPPVAFALQTLAEQCMQAQAHLRPSAAEAAQMLKKFH